VTITNALRHLQEYVEATKCQCRSNENSSTWCWHCIFKADLSKPVEEETTRCSSCEEVVPLSEMTGHGFCGSCFRRFRMRGIL
jgi:hypothetical protein